MNEETKNPAKEIKKSERKTATSSVLEKSEEAFAYIGPPLKQIVQDGAVFKCGYPERLKTCLEKYPFLKGLLIPVSKLAEARKELRTDGTSLFMLYEKASRISDGGNVDV